MRRRRATQVGQGRCRSALSPVGPPHTCRRGRRGREGGRGCGGWAGGSGSSCKGQGDAEFHGGEPVRECDGDEPREAFRSRGKGGQYTWEPPLPSSPHLALPSLASPQRPLIPRPLDAGLLPLKEGKELTLAFVNFAEGTPADTCRSMCTALDGSKPSWNMVRGPAR